MLIGRVTGLEPAPGKLIAVELSPRAISRAAAIDLSQGGLERLQLKAALGRMGVKAGRVHVVTWDTEHIHRTQLLPPMTAAERSQFLERELAREGGGAKAVGAQVLRQVEDGARKDEVLVVAAPREGLDRLLVPFRASGLVPHLIATAPLALLRAVQALSPIPPDRPTIIGHWGLAGLTVAVVSDGVLKLARQIPRLAAPGLDPIEWMATEVQRSVRAYAQISKGGRAEQMLFANADAALERFFADPAALESRLGLPVLNLNQVLRSVLPDGAEEQAGLPAGAFLLPYGAALLTPREAPNLFPREIVVEQRSRRVVRAAVAAVSVLALALGWSYWGASREAAALGLSLQRHRQANRALQATRSEVERIDGERQQVRRWIKFLTDDPLGGPPLAEALREVSRLAPDRLRLERLVISKDEGGYGAKLVGAVKLAELAQAQAQFNQLYFGLRDSTFFYDVTFLPEGDKKKEGAPAVVEGRRVVDIRRQQPGSREVVRAAEEQLAFELALRVKEMR
ncbi:MAG: hypothetical protein HY613_05375 [Candidatus Rokubacteria bacterium]|nr:hypothetical protein [Candidatus Rokubacteria bacterium]